MYSSTSKWFFLILSLTSGAEQRGTADRRTSVLGCAGDGCQAEALEQGAVTHSMLQSRKVETTTETTAHDSAEREAIGVHRAALNEVARGGVSSATHDLAYMDAGSVEATLRYGATHFVAAEENEGHQTSYERARSALIEFSAALKQTYAVRHMVPLLVLMLIPIVIVITCVLTDPEFRRTESSKELMVNASPRASRATQINRSPMDPPTLPQTSDACDSFDALVSLQNEDAYSEPQSPKFLCSDLVVPQGSECAVILPRLSSTPAASGELGIDDLRGCSVFRASYSGCWLRSVSQPGGSQSTLISLMSCGSDVIFASARVHNKVVTFFQGPAPPRSPNAPTLYAEMNMNLPPSQAFTALRCSDGHVIRFRDEEGFDSNALESTTDGTKEITALDKEGRILAVVQFHSQQKRLVRVGPLVDVGFIALALLSIDFLRS